MRSNRVCVEPSWRPINYFSTTLIARERLRGLHEPPQWELPYFALRRRVADLAAAGATGIRITYERDGRVHRLTHAERDPELAHVPWLPNKLMLMRAVQTSDRGYCLW